MTAQTRRDPATATTTAASAGPASDGLAPTAGGDLSRLNAFDGLFLRAEHLIVIQDYARDLALAGGAAGGPGVVEGFAISAGPGDTASLDISPGLAVDADGRPLRSRTVINLPLTGALVPPLPTNGFWWIEILAASWPHGDAQVTGTLCDEPCGGGTSKRLYLAEGVQARLSAGDRPGLGNASPFRRRSWLAGVLFAEEEADGQRQTLSATGALGAVDTWRPAAPPPPSSRQPVVRIGVLIPGGAQTPDEVDTWAARRDRDVSPPGQHWRWRLGMRPWQVFVAQILQFQQQLAERYGGTVPPSEQKLVLDAVEQLRRAGDLAAGRTKQVTGRILAQLADELTARAGTAVDPGETLLDLGFLDLPPAGFLPYPHGDPAGVAGWLAKMLPAELATTICECRMADVAQAFEGARHRGRIPLESPDRTTTAVTILVPLGDDGDLLADWVAFVRSDETACPPPDETEDPTDEVEVFVVDDRADRDRFAADVTALLGGTIPDRIVAEKAEDVQKHLLRYPPGAWSLPTDDGYPLAYATVQRALEEAPTALVFALVVKHEDAPLGVLRGTLLGTPFLSSQRLGPVQAVTHRAPGRRPAIVVVQGPVDINALPG